MKNLFTLLLLTFLVGCSNNKTSNLGKPKASKLAVNYKEIAKHPLGTDKNPIRVNGPSGQRAYLSRLICSNGKGVSNFSRIGSAGLGPYGFIMDVYGVNCSDSNSVVYMDMYHSSHKENKPPNGFTIK